MPKFFTRTGPSCGRKGQPCPWPWQCLESHRSHRAHHRTNPIVDGHVVKVPQRDALVVQFHNRELHVEATQEEDAQVGPLTYPAAPSLFVPRPPTTQPPPLPKVPLKRWQPWTMRADTAPSCKGSCRTALWRHGARHGRCMYINHSAAPYRDRAATFKPAGFTRCVSQQASDQPGSYYLHLEPPINRKEAEDSSHNGNRWPP